MKRLVVLFICLISLPAFADLSGVGNVTISKKIAIPRKILEQVISADSELKPYLDAMLKKYDSHYQMYGRYEFTRSDVQNVCSAAIDILKTNDDCLRRVLYPIKEKMGKVTLKDVCNIKGTVVGGTPYCIDDVFVEKKGDNTNPYHQDVNVAHATALGFAIEYGKANGHDLWCGAQPVNDAILCTDYDYKDYKFYSFKFAGVNNTSGGTIQNNVGRGICALHNAKYEYRGAPTCIMNCAVGTAARDTISKFGMEIISPDTTTDSCTMKLPVLKDKDLRTYPGYEYMTTAFANVQTVLNGSLSKIIKQYVRFQGLPIQSFECEYSSRGYYPYSVSYGHTPNPSFGIGWNIPAENLPSIDVDDNEKIYGSTDSEPIDDVLRCKINGYDVDFVFDDLYESKEYQQKIGKDALGCISMGGNYSADTTCRGLTREVCLSKAVQEAITGGTYWNKEAQVCMLNNAESVRNFRNAIDIGTGVVIGLAIGWYAGPVIALVSIAGDLAINSAFIALEDYAINKPNSRATAFLNDVKECGIMPNQAACDNEQKQCAYEIFKNHFARLQEVINDLNNDQIEEVSELMDTVSNCLSDGELIKSISESDVWMKDKLIEQSAMFIMIGGVLWSPETMVAKLAQKFPKLGKIFERMKVLGYVDEGANGVRYLQIDGLNDTEINQINMHLRNESFSVQRTVRNGKNVISFSKNSDLRYRLSENFDKYLADFKTNGRNVRIPARISEDELIQLNKELSGDGVFLVYYMDDDGVRYTVYADGKYGEVLNKYGIVPQIRMADKNSLKHDYYRIVIGEKDDYAKIVNDLQKNGFYVSSNKTDTGELFIGVSKDNIFSAWDNNPNNWLKFGKPGAAGLGGKLKGWNVQTIETVKEAKVFKFVEKNSGKTFYLKSTDDATEIERTKKAYDILNNQSDIVHIVKVIEDDQGVLVDFVRRHGITHPEGEYLFITEEVPSSLSAYNIINDSGAEACLRGVPITLAEQEEILRSVKKLRDAGLYHGDLSSNMFFLRESNGRLRVDIIDFESWAAKDVDIEVVQQMFDGLSKVGLAQKADNAVSMLDDIVGRYNKKSVFRAAAENSLGSDYYRISVNDNDDVFGLINDLQKNGFFVSANQTIHGEKFIAVSKENVFQSWSNSPTNWLKGYRGGIVRGRGIFDNIYNDMPEDVLKRKLEYIYDVERKGGSNLDIVNAMKQVGAFDEVAAKRLAQDVADETINRIKADPRLVEQGKNWRILSKTEKEEFVRNVHDFVTRERRKRAGNTEIILETDNPDLLGWHAGPYGNKPREFGYNVDAYDSAADALETIIHENTHSFQSVYKSSIPKQLVDLSRKHYVSPKVDYDGYRNVLIEVEARYVADQAVPIIARALRW
jgi:hypothetical protein